MTMPAPQQPSQPLFEQESRFALVMYGGVSLAIYINGVTQEFFNLVRATAVDNNGNLIYADDRLPGTAAVYRELASIARPGGEGEPDATLRTRFLVDIASGTSAGGINAIFLAKAIANGSSLNSLSRLWLDQGDLCDLLNDAHGRDRRQFSQDPPKSLLSSRGMYSKLLDAFIGMDDPAKTPAPLQPEVDVFVTSTDIQGLELPIALADMQVFESRHKNVFHLRFATDRGGHSTVNHFTPELNSFLAFAARSTSSFPFAFEPMSLDSIDDVVAAKHASGKLLTSEDEALRQFFPDYVSASSDSGYRRRCFGDGGYLDNKPFTYAIETLSRRTTDLPMQRKLVYIEPSPDVRKSDAIAPPPNFIENAVAAAITLKQEETIREDLQRVLDRNRLIERVLEVTAKLDDDIREWKSGRNVAKTRMNAAEYGKRTVKDDIADRGPGYAGYHRLKVRSVTDDLAGIITRAAELMEDSDEFRAIRLIIGQWRLQAYPETETTNNENLFLLKFDLSYRQRRLRFLLTKLDERCHGGSAAERQEFKELKRELNVAADLLGDLEGDARKRGRENFAHDAVKGLGIDPVWLHELLAMTDAQRADAIREYLQTAAAKVDNVAAVVSEKYRAATVHAADLSEECLDTSKRKSPERAWLRHYFEEYEYYDQVIFPIFYQTSVGEAEPADVIRISPMDARSVIDESSDRRRKLAGTVLFHFGAFFDRLWRSNDILWGRLDGAERIISTVLPRSSRHAARLIRSAHLAIIHEHLRPQEQAELKNIIVRAILSMPREDRNKELTLRRMLEAQTRSPVDSKVDAVFTACLDDEQILEYLKGNYEVNREFNPAYTLDALGRSTRIVGRMLEEVAKNAQSEQLRSSAGAGAAAWIARLGAVFWSLVQLAVPGGLGNNLFRHWVKILYAFELLLLAGSTLALSQETQQFAVTALILTAGTHLLATVLGDMMRTRHWAFRVPLFVLAVVLLALAGIGAWTLRERFVPELNCGITKRLPWAGQYDIARSCQALPMSAGSAMAPSPLR